MTAGLYSFTIDQGAQYTTQIIWADSSGNPINLTGYTAAMQLRLQAASPDPSALNLTSSNGGITITPLAGEMDILMTSAQTGSLDPGFYVYDLEIALGSVVTRIIQGQITVSAQVTQ